LPLELQLSTAVTAPTTTFGTQTQINASATSSLASLAEPLPTALIARQSPTQARKPYRMLARAYQGTNGTQSPTLAFAIFLPTPSIFREELV
jgi:hypothetical protein